MAHAITPPYRTSCSSGFVAVSVPSLSPSPASCPTAPGVPAQSADSHTAVGKPWHSVLCGLCVHMGRRGKGRVWIASQRAHV